MIQSAILRKKFTDPYKAFATLDPSNPLSPPKFYLMKAEFTPEEIAKIVGFAGAPEKLLQAKIIRLSPVGDQSKWQKPTVRYTGEA